MGAWQQKCRVTELPKLGQRRPMRTWLTSGQRAHAVRSRRCIPCAFVVLLVLATGATRSDVDSIEGFTEPNCTVNVATAEVGVIKRIYVREGNLVTKGQVLATLDQEMQVALLAIAAEKMHARGRLESAQAELDLRQNKL